MAVLKNLFSDDDRPSTCGHAGQLGEEQQGSEAAMDGEEGEEEAATHEEEGEEEAAEEEGEEEEEVVEVAGGQVAVDQAMPEVRRNAEMEGGGPRTWTSGGYRCHEPTAPAAQEQVAGRSGAGRAGGARDVASWRSHKCRRSARRWRRTGPRNSSRGDASAPQPPRVRRHQPSTRSRQT